MKFDREELLEKLNVAKLAIDSREFIPILSHFCFQGKYVTAYDDFIGIQVNLHTNFSCALQAGTLLQLLNSVSAKEIELGFTDQKVFFRSGKQRTGVRARLPYINEDDFFFKWPNIKRLNKCKLTGPQARRFFDGLGLCLSSVGKQTPTQMGITMMHDGKQLKLYSTNNHAISVFGMKDWGSGFDNRILSTAFCKAVLKAREVYGDKDVVFSMAEDFVLLTFGDQCKIYGKLVNNKDPLDFGKVVASFIPKSHHAKRQVMPPELAEGFARALVILAGDITKQVIVHLDDKTVTVEAKSSLGKLKSGSKFGDNWPVAHFQVDAELAVTAIADASYVYFAEKAVIFSHKSYMHLLSTSSVE